MAASRSPGSSRSRTNCPEQIGCGRRGHRDGPALEAALNRPFSVCVVPTEHERRPVLAFSDMHNNAVRFVLPQPHAGGYQVKTLSNSGLLAPKGICATRDGRYLFVCDSGHHKIKFAALKKTSGALTTGHANSSHAFVDRLEMFTFAGSGKKGCDDGPVLECSFNAPSGICECADGTILIADTGNHCIRQVSRSPATGKLVVKTIAGGSASYQMPSTVRAPEHMDEQAFQRLMSRSAGYQDGARALFRSPSGIVEGRFGEILIADTMNHCIRGLARSPSKAPSSTWIVRTVCGIGHADHVDGACIEAAFSQPMDLCWGSNGSLFVSDRGNGCIREIGGCKADCTGSPADGLEYNWVRTVNLGRSVCFPPPVLGSSRLEKPITSYPLGIACLPISVLNYGEAEADRAGESTLLVCDGGANRIRCIDIESEDASMTLSDYSQSSLLVSSERRKSTQSMTTHFVDDFRSELDEIQSIMSISNPESTESGDSEFTVDDCNQSESVSKMQSSDSSKEMKSSCQCEHANAFFKVMAENAMLKEENTQLKELLYRTFDEIQCVNSALARDTDSSNRMPGILEHDE